jgi:hypothetical protein
LCDIRSQSPDSPGETTSSTNSKGPSGVGAVPRTMWEFEVHPGENGISFDHREANAW